MVVVVHLLPPLLLQYFITHDGPAHVYSASVIARLLGGDSLNADFYEFNPFPVPNLFGHILLCFLNLFLDGNVSERIVICLYVAALPLSFRYFLLTLNPNGQWASYLCFPFIYSLMFYLGFYNFLLGMPVLFLSLVFFIRNENSLTPKNLAALAMLGLLMYLCHLFILTFFILAVAAIIATDFLRAMQEKKSRESFKPIYRKAGFMALALAPCLLLALAFLITHPEKGDTFGAMIKSEALYNLFIARPLITLKFDTEFDYAVTISCAFWLLFLYNIIAFSRNLRFQRKTALLVISVALLAAYFFVPDQLGSGSFVSHRLLMFFYLFALLWVGTNAIPNLVKVSSAFFFVMVSLVFLNYHYQESKSLSANAKEYVSVQEAIPKGSIVLPLAYSGNWMHTNISNYISADKNIIMLDNYEAAMTHFPLKWKKETNPYTGMNFSTLDLPCAGMEAYETNIKKDIGYILRWGYNPATDDSCTKATDQYIHQKYERVFVSKKQGAELFRKKETKFQERE